MNQKGRALVLPPKSLPIYLNMIFNVQTNTSKPSLPSCSIKSMNVYCRSYGSWLCEVWLACAM